MVLLLSSALCSVIQVVAVCLKNGMYKALKMSCVEVQNDVNLYMFCMLKCPWAVLYHSLDRSIFYLGEIWFIIAPACSRVLYRRPIFCPSVRPSVCLSTFMSTFDIYVKVSILINYKTKQPSNLAWNISLTSWLCNIGICFSVCLSIRPSVCQHLCRSLTFMSKLVF